MDPLLNLATKTEVDRVKAARSVREALATQGDDMVVILAPKFDPELFPEPGAEGSENVTASFAARLQESTPRRIIDKSIAWLDRIESDVVTTGRAYRTLKVKRLSANRSLRRTSEKVASAVIGLRDQVFSVYGEEAAIDLGFARVTPTGPGEVLENSLHLEGRLSDLPELPEPAPGRLAIDFSAVVAVLSPLIRELERAMAQYQTMLRLSQSALFRKHRAIRAFDKDLRYLSGTAENLFDLAGLPREAELVLPSSRRRSVNGETDPPGEGETGGEDTSGEGVDAVEVTGGPAPQAGVAGEAQETLSDDSSVVTAPSAEAPAEE